MKRHERIGWKGVSTKKKQGISVFVSDLNEPIQMIEMGDYESLLTLLIKNNRLVNAVFGQDPAVPVTLLKLAVIRIVGLLNPERKVKYISQGDTNIDPLYHCVAILLMFGSDTSYLFSSSRLKAFFCDDNPSTHAFNPLKHLVLAELLFRHDHRHAQQIKVKFDPEFMKTYAYNRKLVNTLIGRKVSTVPNLSGACVLPKPHLERLHMFYRFKDLDDEVDYCSTDKLFQALSESVRQRAEREAMQKLQEEGLQSVDSHSVVIQGKSKDKTGCEKGIKVSYLRCSGYWQNGHRISGRRLFFGLPRPEGDSSAMFWAATSAGVPNMLGTVSGDSAAPSSATEQSSSMHEESPRSLSK